MKQLVTLMTLAAGLCIVSGANAHDGEGRPVPPAFDEIDTNSDQLISMEEIQAAMQGRGHNRGGNRFERADIDGDGFINESEFDAIRENMSKHRGRHRGHGDCEAADETD